MAEIDFMACVKQGVDKAMEDCELTIGMTLKEAVEKQIPKKPINLSVRYWGSAIGGNCPNCQSEANSKEYRYCRNCGQRIDWGQENESTK